MAKKKKNKKPIIYILFDYIPIEFILLGVIIVHLEIGTFLLNMGIGNILPSYDIYYSEYEMAYITLGFVPIGRLFYLYMLHTNAFIFYFIKKIETNFHFY